jgi:hypothetical protein
MITLRGELIFLCYHLWVRFPSFSMSPKHLTLSPNHHLLETAFVFQIHVTTAVREETDLYMVTDDSFVVEDDLQER